MRAKAATLAGMNSDSNITVTSAAELVAVAPYVIGFHPADSLVVLGILDDRIAFGMRYDLPPPDGVPPESRVEEENLVQLVARQSMERVVVLGYGPPGRVTPAVLGLAGALTDAGVPVADAIRVGDGRWWSCRCDEPQCCPPAGRPIDTALPAAAVYRGMVALPDRQSLVDRLAPMPGVDQGERAAAAERARERLAVLRADDLAALRGGGLLRRAGRRAVRLAEAGYRPGGMPTVDEIAWLGVLLAEPEVLDYALTRAMRSSADLRIRLWTDVLRRVDADYLPGPACLLALAAWRSGDGTLARVAVDRALEVDPRHRIAGVIDALLCSGVGPAALAGLPPPRRRLTRIRRRAL